MNKSYNPMLAMGFDMNANNSIITPAGIYIPIITILEDMNLIVISSNNSADYGFDNGTISITEKGYYLILDMTITKVNCNPAVSELIYITTGNQNLTIDDGAEGLVYPITAQQTIIVSKIIGDGVVMPEGVEMVFPLSVFGQTQPVE